MMDTNTLPDFLRFSRHGHVLSLEERKRVAEARGVCSTCGRVTHKVTTFRRKSLDDEDVYNGICLVCNPEQRQLAKSKREQTGDLELGERRPRRSHRKGDKQLKTAMSVQVSSTPKSPAKERLYKSVTNISEDTDKIKQLTSNPDFDAPSKSSKQRVNQSWDILRDMRSNPEDVELLTRKCRELGTLGSLESGSMYEIIDVMNRFPQEIELQLSGIVALWAFVMEGGDDVKLEAIDANILEIIQQAVDLADDGIISSSAGLISCLAEGLGVRAILLEEDVINMVENMLERCLECKTFDARVLYWTFRCLLSFVTTTKEHNEFITTENFELDCDLLEDLEAIDDIKQVILKGKTVRNVILGMQKTQAVECMTLQLGMEFLASILSSHHLGRYDKKKEPTILDVCKQTVEIEHNVPFPVMKNLACACLCFNMEKNGTITNNRKLAEKAGFADGFIEAAMDVLRVKRDKDIVERHVMMCTLSYIFFCQDLVINDSPNYNAILRCCITMMTDNPSNKFVRESSLWIFWGVLSIAPNASKTLMTEILGASTAVMSETEDETFTTLLIAILSDIAALTKIRDVEALIAHIYESKSHFESNKIISIEADRFLVSVCKTKKIAHLIANEAQRTTHPVITQNQAIELQYKIAKFTAKGKFTIDDLKSSVKCWHKGGHEVYLAAQILFLQTEKANSYARQSEQVLVADLVKFVTTAMEFIVNILEIPSNKTLQQYACRAIHPIANLAQESNIVNSLNISRCLVAIMETQNNSMHELNAVLLLLVLRQDIMLSLFNDVALFSIKALCEHFNRRDIVSAAITVMYVVLSMSRLDLQALKKNTTECAIGSVIRAIYNCLDSENHADNFQIFLYGMRCLRLCITDSSLHECIIKEGGVVAVIDGMNVNNRNAMVQQEGYSIIRALSSSKFVERRLQIIEADGVDVFLNTLVSYCMDSRLISDAFDLISYLSISRQVRAFIAIQGGLLLIINAMKEHNASLNVSEKGLRALLNLISDIDDRTIEIAGIPAVVSSSISDHLCESSIQEVGISILTILSKRNNGIREEVSGCCNSIITALKIHINNARIVSNSLAVLMNLADTNQFQQSIRGEDTSTLICHAMMVNLHCQKTQVSGCKLLSAISSSIELTTGTVFVETVVYAMLKYHSSEIIQLSGCSLLSCSSYHFRYIKDSSGLDNMIIEAVITAMEHFPSSQTLQDRAMVALESFLPNQSLQTALHACSSRVISAVYTGMTLSTSIETFERGSEIIRVCEL